MKSIRPIIGITLDYQEKDTTQGGYSDLPWYALRTQYAQSIAANGGVPIHISYENDLVNDYLNLCNGFVIPGNSYDVPPKYYNEELRSESNLQINNLRTEFELHLVKEIIKRNIPLLGICGGMQTLNVALGGSLYQDIATEIKTNIVHNSRHISRRYHDVRIKKNSRLYQIVGESTCKVNTIHHQSVKKPGTNILISAVGPDSVVEAIELLDHPFCIGVQWHPEHQEFQHDKNLVKAFISAARTFPRSCS